MTKGTITEQMWGNERALQPACGSKVHQGIDLRLVDEVIIFSNDTSCWMFDITIQAARLFFFRLDDEISFRDFTGSIFDDNKNETGLFARNNAIIAIVSNCQIIKFHIPLANAKLIDTIFKISNDVSSCYCLTSILMHNELICTASTIHDGLSCAVERNPIISHPTVSFYSANNKVITGTNPYRVVSIITKYLSKYRSPTGDSNIIIS